ncbi:MAG TPA: diacylglycerol kinase family protein [Mycobacteriales bacterium]|nr:diacylglycerol kinase family protein [Mycobacteriales bacterium]
MTRIWRGWADWAFRPVDPAPMAALRIAVGVLALGWTLSLLPDAATFLGDEGVSPELPVGGGGAWVLPTSAPYAVLALLGVAAVALVAGLATRVASVAVFLLLLVVQRRDPFVLNSGDLLLRHLAFFVALMPAGEVWSLDARRRSRPPRDRAPWALRLLQLQVSAIYLFAVWAKVRGTTWNDGTAVGIAWQLEDLQRIALPAAVRDSLTLSALASYGTLAVEAALVVGLWLPRLRWAVMAAGVGLHLGIDATMLVGWFSAAILASYLAFVPAPALRSALAHGARMAPRARGSRGSRSGPEGNGTRPTRVGLPWQPERMRPLLLVNSAAGSADDEAIEVVRGVLDAEVARCEGPEDLEAALDRPGDRLLVICGGDGSLHTIVQALHTRGQLARDLALVPLGTGNDFARTLEIDLDPRAAALAARDGQPRRLDLLVDDQGQVVVNVLHAGVGAVAADRAEKLKGRLGIAAYVVGAVQAGISRARWRLLVEVDGTVLHDGPVLQAGIANGRTIGGGTPFAPEADPSDGLLDVVVSVATGPLARLGYAAALRQGSQAERSDVGATRGTTVTITARSTTELNADGELSTLKRGQSRTWRLEPGAWSLRTTSSGA